MVQNPLFHGPLEAKDIALSRRKPGFKSRWGITYFSESHPLMIGAQSAHCFHVELV